MDSLKHILQNRDFGEPDESQAVKDYVQKKFNTKVSVQLRENDIIVGIPSAALATTLRYDMPNLRQAIGTKKQIVLRITG